MSRVFVDTSAIMALLIAGDEHHTRARRSFDRLQATDTELVSTSYVLLETYAVANPDPLDVDFCKTPRVGGGEVPL